MNLDNLSNVVFGDADDEGHISALITKEGVPTDSPISAEKRAVLKEQLMQHINELQVKVRLLEEREKLGKR